MEFSINQLLDNFSDDKLVTPKAIEKNLELATIAKAFVGSKYLLMLLKKLAFLKKTKDDIAAFMKKVW